MIPLFLDPRPDELFYSVCARTQDAMRFAQKLSIGQYLFGNRYANAVVGLPSRLGRVVDALPPGHRYTVDRLIDECTLLPFYTPFLSPNHVARIRMVMGKHENKGATWLGNVMGTYILGRMLRFCPRCVEEERTEFGMCYWHRLHQISCVLVCPVHLVTLEHSTVPIRYTGKLYTFVSAERAIHTISSSSICEKRHILHQLIGIAEDANWLLNHPNTLVGLDSLSLCYRSILTDQGVSTSRGKIDWRRFFTIFRAYYSQELLLLLQCPLDEGSIISLFERVTSKHGLMRKPMYHLLLMQLLGYSSEAFFNLRTNT